MKTVNLTRKMNMWLQEHLAMKTPAKLLGGLALGALVMAVTVLPSGVTYGDELSRPFSSEQTQCYPEDVVLGWCYGFADASDPALATDATISGVQILPEDAWRFDSPYYDDFLVEEPRESVAATVIYRYDRSLDDEFMQTEIYLPGDTYPVSSQAEDLPAFLQTEIWLPGDTYPVFGR